MVPYSKRKVGGKSGLFIAPSVEMHEYRFRKKVKKNKAGFGALFEILRPTARCIFPWCHGFAVFCWLAFGRKWRISVGVSSRVEFRNNACGPPIKSKGASGNFRNALDGNAAQQLAGQGNRRRGRSVGGRNVR